MATFNIEKLHWSQFCYYYLHIPLHNNLYHDRYVTSLNTSSYRIYGANKITQNYFVKYILLKVINYLKIVFLID